MDYGYIIKISNRNLYKEIQLPAGMGKVKVGTGLDCDIRFYRTEFLEPFDITFSEMDGVWHVGCSSNVYIDAGDIRKITNKKLYHGEAFPIRYHSSNGEVFRIEFMLDFDNEEKVYDREIDLSSVGAVCIGSSLNNDIVLENSYARRDNIILQRGKEGLILSINSTTYGIYHDGRLAKNGETICSGDFISIANYSFFYKDDKLHTSSMNPMQIKGLQYIDLPERFQYPKFVRNTRIKTVLDEEVMEVLDPPAKPQKPQNNLLMRLLPSVGMLGASAVMAFMGGTMIIFSAISGGMAILTAILGVVQNNKDFKKKSAERIDTYNTYIENKRKEVTKARDEERLGLEELYISQEEEIKRFYHFSPDLFERRREDEDYLCVRLGYGKVKARKAISHKKQEKLEFEDDLQKIPEQVCKEFADIDNAPVVCDFKKNNAIGIVGTIAHRAAMMNNVVIDLCARHYHTDVKFIFIAEEEHKDDVYWLRMLPQVNNESLGIRNIACNDKSKNAVFEYLFKELTIREEKKTYQEDIIVFLFDAYGFKSHPISKFVDNARALGVVFVFFGDTGADISMGCGHIIEILSHTEAKLIDAENKAETRNFTYQAIDRQAAKNIVQMLAPVYTEEISLEGSLTKNISLFELFNIIAVEDLNLGWNWQASKVTESMVAPIGVSKGGIIGLDLHEKHHGPHGLVAGTTGSGKSEILQTYILSMATLYEPRDVSFVIIDFKGGGMANQFRNLPHLLGAITNIDGKEINRSLKSIKAELEKRQRLFAEADVESINKYIKKFKAGEIDIPLPHLIIIVDEFAELKAEQPEFMKELISAARIGRSLGVHLILATQKPSGQVNEQIWSNSRFKLCLKVQSQEDSNEVIKSPLAAEIREPGRAYLQVGNNEIFELFQSAYSGAPEKMEDSKVREFSIFELTDHAERKKVFEQKKTKMEGNVTQLDALVNYIHDYCEQINMKKLPDICLPSLREIIVFPKEKELLPKNSLATTELGIFDDPNRQYQGYYTVDLASQNIMIIGSAQSGKTNLLQCMVKSLTSKYTPKEVNIYIIDFASMVMKNFGTLAHVGGVVTASEDEKLKNLIKLLYSEIELRKEKMLAVGVSSFTAYKEAGCTDLPQIVLMIDNLTALKELYFQDDDELLRLCRESLTVGISVVIANSQTSGIGYKYLSNFSCRIAMFCNDSGEYGSLFDHCRE